MEYFLNSGVMFFITILKLNTAAGQRTKQRLRNHTYEKA